MRACMSGNTKNIDVDLLLRLTSNDATQQQQ